MALYLSDRHLRRQQRLDHRPLEIHQNIVLPSILGNIIHHQSLGLNNYPLVDPLDGRGGRAVAYDDPADMGSVWPAATPERELQALDRPAVCGQGAGHRWPLHVSEADNRVLVLTPDFKRVAKLSQSMIDRDPSVLSARYEEDSTQAIIRSLGRSSASWPQ